MVSQPMVRSVTILLLALALGCDKASDASSEKQPTAVAPEPAKVEPPATPTPEPEPPAVAPVSEFDDLLVRVSGLADPKHASDPTLEQDNKTAWTHYKAKHWSEAAQFFARVAARDPEWKHAHNLACASAKADRPDDARIALVESLRRGGDAAKASAKNDSDLAAVRALPWFAALVDPPATVAEEELDEDEQAPPNCPAGTKYEDEHYCWVDMLAEFVFEEVAFTTPVSLDLDVPTKPKNKRWKHVNGKIPWTALRTELGIQHTIESHGLSQTSELLEWSREVEGHPFEDEETAPFFWWPEDNTPVLVLPHKQKAGTPGKRFVGVILARKTDAGWRAVNLAVATEQQLNQNSNFDFESGVVLRFDQLELFTLTQFTFDGSDEPASNRFLCRIRWEQGKLARACTDRWKDAGMRG
jgi:hypothetical protein